ncbi:hypothetical protein CLV28_1384 [Sediminihabitans luteus]|uniref:PIN domain-containing protein n=1 Tax=Sediminihabitans luteus TaxID=1138585 RepID=A0A2M9CPS7_9CELL|nr:PIN domain-containing protein [Sediminihabitans luteus]PJJ73900.1 hypothetical protein CLV28_1384 [Sediminihabitans luteus]GII98188.1 hypothetical protein Slu03_05660 [Sediminihabitans luteus]
MTAYLVDNSVWARVVLRSPLATARIEQIRRSPADYFVTCPPQVLEFCHSAPAGRYAAYREAIGLGFPLDHHPDEALVLDIQQGLWEGGLFRAAGAIDILIAAYALLNDATVLTADRDFGHIASVTHDLRYEYVPPDGDGGDGS